MWVSPVSQGQQIAVHQSAAGHWPDLARADLAWLELAWLELAWVGLRTQPSDFLYDAKSDSLCCPSPNYCCPNSLSSCASPSAILFDAIRANVTPQACAAMP